MGLEVMAQVPEAHPTNFQYRKPAKAPTKTPEIVIIFFFIKSLIILFSLIEFSINHEVHPWYILSLYHEDKVFVAVS